MDLTQITEPLAVREADLSGSVFRRSKLAGTRFEDVNMAGARFDEKGRPEA